MLQTNPEFITTTVTDGASRRSGHVNGASRQPGHANGAPRRAARANAGPQPAARADGVVRKRMSVADRERHILDGAISLFAEHGFGANLRELARAVGVTHTLVYHYFPTKQALVDRVYAEVFAGRWKPEWEALLDSRTLSPEDKLIRFYVDYAHTVLTREFVRLLVFAGLTEHSISDRFFALLAQRLFPRLIRETRRYRACTSRTQTTAREHELLLGLHGGIFYGGMRWFVYDQTIHPQQPALDDEQHIADRVRAYLAASAALEPQGQTAAHRAATKEPKSLKAPTDRVAPAARITHAVKVVRAKTAAPAPVAAAAARKISATPTKHRA